MESLFRRTYDTQKLMETHPPRWQHPYKKLVARVTCPEGCTHTGEITVTRWKSVPFPTHLPEVLPLVEARPDFFTYEQSETSGEWYLNFADRSLFGYYDGPLLAQDELQVLEHPALGAVREALLFEKLPALTVEGKPTPVLVQNVERRGALDTSALYGNRFASATPEKILGALKVLIPPTRSNILAMEAIPGGHGFYKKQELEFTLTTAFTGFAAARFESVSESVTIHTGFWGCGAYGGNRLVMVMLQLLAARLAGVPKIVFHTGDAPGLSTITDAQEWLERLATDSVAETLTAIHAEGFRWGVSDGN
jgi:hypothetical protein